MGTPSDVGGLLSGARTQIVETPVLAPERVPRLTVLKGPDVGRRFDLHDGILLGRADDAAIAIADTGVSRHHARIHVSDGVRIEDLGSSNGTFVNGRRIERAALTHGDQISLGRTVMLGFGLESAQEDQVLQAQKLEVLGQLSAGVTHDLNNLLSILVASVAALRDLSGESRVDHPEVRECLDDIETATARATELTTRLAGFVRGGTGVQQDVDLSALCEEAVRLLKRTMPASVRLDVRIERGLFVSGDPAQLYQLLVNPCINARDAMKQGGVLTLIASGTVEAVRVEVRDTGSGMSPATLERAFEPFFTTKGRAGTGLGLSIVKRIAEAHGGKATITSEVGSGTRVVLHLPACAPPRLRRLRKRQATQHEFSERPPAMRAGRVLVVDDEEVVRRALGRVLKRLGYEVTGAQNGDEALELIQSGGPRPDLVMLDLSMPVMDGIECFERLMEVDREIPVVFVSGSANLRQSRPALTQLGARGFLRKPIDVDALTETVHDILGR